MISSIQICFTKVWYVIDHMIYEVNFKMQWTLDREKHIYVLSVCYMRGYQVHENEVLLYVNIFFFSFLHKQRRRKNYWKKIIMKIKIEEKKYKLDIIIVNEISIKSNIKFVFKLMMYTQWTFSSSWILVWFCKLQEIFCSFFFTPALAQLS